MGQSEDKKTKYSQSSGQNVEALGKVIMREYKCPACNTYNSVVKLMTSDEVDELKQPMRNQFFVHVDLKGDLTAENQKKLLGIMVEAGFDVTLQATDKTFCLPSAFFYYSGFEHAACVHSKVQNMLSEFEDVSVFTIEQINTVFNGFEAI